MKFVCDRCQTRYSIADEKVRQKILRIRCKTCGNVILVQESAGLPEGGSEGSEPHPPQKAPSSGLRLPPAASKAASGPKLHPAAGVGAASGPKLAPSASGRPASEPKLAPMAPAKAPSGPKAPPVPPNKAASGPKLQPTESHGARVVTPPPPPPAAVAADPLGGRVEWYVATGGAQSGPFSRADAAKRILAVDPGKAVHVWKEGMAGWKPASEVSVIVAEINVLRPTPPPPPPSSSLTPPPAALPQPAHAAVHGASVPSAHLSPGPGSKTPAPAPAGKLSSFANLATLGDASASGDEEADAFLEATTRKSQRVVDAVAAPVSASFTDATTKKGKNLRDLEEQLSEPSAFPIADEPRTPPPVRPLPPANARAVEVSRLALGEPPTLPNPLLPPEAESLVTFDSAKKTPRPSVPLGGFSEVVAAVAAAPRPGMSAGSVFAPDGASPSTAFLDVVPEKPRLVQLLERQPGLKYVFAAAALVVLVLLLVLVILRGDATKVPEATKEPVKEEPAPPIEEPAKVEEPQAAAKKLTVMPIEEARSSGSRSAARHSSKAHLQAEKPSIPEPVSKPSTRPGRGDAPRPNPFAEGPRAVSQDQISAVVRNPANQAGLRSCYERALKMDNHLTSGRLDITVSVSASGVVDRVMVNAPANFILVEPCIKNAVRRWRFPAGGEEYGTSFPLILQGGS